MSAANVSKKDLKERLVRKGEDPDQADAAVKWMEDMAILDDGRTAGKWWKSASPGATA